MSHDLTAELDEALEQYPAGTLNASKVGILRIIADGARHENDDEHKGGKRRKAGSQLLRPRQTFIDRERLAQRVGIGPRGIGKQLRELEDLGLKLRVSDARPGRAMVYQFPTRDELLNALKIAAIRREVDKANGVTVVNPLSNCG